MEDAAINVLLVGSGGREHALAWKLKQSARLNKLYAAPGNAGIAELAELAVLDVADHDAVIAFVQAQEIGLVVVGPEQPLVAGLVDALDAAGIAAFGPSAAAAQLEGSKGFTKDLCAKAGIPTAAYRRFTDLAAAKAALPEFGVPVVIKADGLAAGKGVVIATTVSEATEALDDMFGGSFGGAGAEVVIEAFMTGEEASLFAITDGEYVLPFGSAQDHKRVGDGDLGPNTGGMGAYSPARVLTPELEARALAEIVEPTVRAMAAAGTPYRGVLYAGLMLTDSGPQLIEYNCRFGDPECQVLMLRLESDLIDILLAACKGRLRDVRPTWSADPALTVVMAANGYPGAVEKGSVIGGVAAAEQGGAKVFHAGTARDAAGALIATGGRVLNVSATGSSVRDAQQAAYRAVDAIDWPGGFCRRDIGWREAEREALEGKANAG